MSEKFYRKARRYRTDAYAIGAAFERRGMQFVRRRGWHAMRRFGSIGVYFCPRCLQEMARPRKGKKGDCPRCHIEGVKASLDWTAYKNGIYVMVTSKFRSDRASVPLDDPTWQNMVLYASKFGAVPLFQGVTEDRHIYFIDLRTLANFDLFYRYPKHQKPDEDQMSRALVEAWNVIDFCNQFIGEKAPDKCKVCKMRARWTEIKVKMLNILNRILWRAGKTESGDDLTKLFEDEEEKKDDKNTS